MPNSLREKIKRLLKNYNIDNCEPYGTYEYTTNQTLSDIIKTIKEEMPEEKETAFTHGNVILYADWNSYRQELLKRLEK